MKTIILSSLVCLGLNVFAAEEKALLNCTVPAETGSKISLKAFLTKENAGDFVRVILSEESKSSEFYIQLGKDEMTNNMKNQGFGVMLVTEKTRQDKNGAILNAGFMGMSKQENKYSGFLSANGNIYVLECAAAVE